MAEAEATKRCQFCGEEILAVAVKCKHCGEMMGPAPRSATPGVASPEAQPAATTKTRWTPIVVTGIAAIIMGFIIPVLGFFIPIALYALIRFLGAASGKPLTAHDAKLWNVAQAANRARKQRATETSDASGSGGQSAAVVASPTSTTGVDASKAPTAKNAWWLESASGESSKSASGSSTAGHTSKLVRNAILAGVLVVVGIWWFIQASSDHADEVRAQRATAEAATEAAKYPSFSVHCENGSQPVGAAGHEEWCQKTLSDGGRVRDGEYRAWNVQGEEIAEGHYIVGLQDGLWTTLAKEEPTGLVKTLSPYKRGRLDGVVHRLQARDELSDGEYKNGVLVRSDTWSGAGSERVIETCMYRKQGKPKCRKAPDPEQDAVEAQGHPYGTPSAQRAEECEAKYRPAIEACSADKPGCDDRCHYLCASMNETYLKACTEGRSD